jgi:hypothetical protein
MGRDVLDTNTATPGVLLAGCHESQFDVKALKTSNNTIDPWMFAVVNVIRNQIVRKRGVPSYSTLYNNAKQFIRQQIISGQMNGDRRYQGPSPNELDPVPRNMESQTSNQDPQMSFFDGYFDPGEERFLFPFVAPYGGKAGGQATRFPRDEYPSDELPSSN